MIERDNEKTIADNLEDINNAEKDEDIKDLIDQQLDLQDKQSDL